MRQLIKAGILLMFIGLLSGCSKTEAKSKFIETYAYVESESSYLLENDDLIFELDPSTTYFTVTDKSNGTKWYSNPMDAGEDTLAFGENKNQLLSTLVIEYSTSIGVSKVYNNYEYSITRELYEIEQSGNAITVNYSIGDIVKAFIIPRAIAQSRMNELLDRMDSSSQKQIKEYYRLYDFNNLRSSDNKNELLQKYPDIEEEPIYELRSNIREYLKAVLETIFEEAGYTTDDYLYDMEKYSLEDEAGRDVYNVSITYSLEGNDLVVGIPFDKMEWSDEYPLTKIKVLPFMGAGGIEDEGYLLVPEGSGAVIEFNNGKTRQSNYYADVYGWDYGKKRSTLVDESRASFPVFGIAKNGSSMLCILEDYASLATIEADISEKINHYNSANATYRIVQGDTADVTAKSDSTIMIYEKREFVGELKQRYTFLDSSDYQKMAESYRTYLIKTHEGVQKKNEESVPVSISIVGGIDKVKQRFGMPMSVDVPLTTYNEAKTLLEDLVQRGFQDMHLVYIGWMNGGIKHTALNKIKTISALGGKKDLENFISYAQSVGVPIYLEGNVMFAYDNGIFDGYAINQDSAKHTTREVAKLYDFSPVTFRTKTWADSYYLVKPQVMEEYIRNLLKSANSFAVSGIALRDVGYKLASDYNPKNHINREEVMKLQRDLLKEIKLSGSGTVTYGGYDYVFGYSDYVLDMDLYGGKYMILDYMVPFYQMAIHGLVDYFGTSINLAADYTDMILKSAEYGAGLSFTFVMEPPTTLQESYYYTYLYGSDYERWKDLATEIYNRYHNELSHCFNQYMKGHERIADGVFMTLYEDGTKVYVNYNYRDYVYGDISIPARDYKVERGTR